MAAQRSPGRNVSGILLLDKPYGLSSNQALQRAKRLFHAAKAGHSGSLDPLATGMLPICFGPATTLCAYLLDARKTYAVDACLGVATTTGDAEGEIVERDEGPGPSETEVRAAASEFRGELEQVPPMYSAIKRDGAPLYRLARRGIEVPREPRRIMVYSFDVEGYRWPKLELRVVCSKGTYVRTLVTDLAARLGTVGYVQGLRRSSVEPYAEAQLCTFEALERAAAAGGLDALDAELETLDSALPGWPAVTLGPDEAQRLIHGQKIPADAAWPRGRLKVYGADRRLLAIAEVTPDGLLAPRRVFMS